MVEKPSDEILAANAKEGDVKSFEELFARYKKPILNFIYRMIGNKETAEEVAQEVFIKMYKNLEIYDPGKKFATWLYTIARNLAKNALRDRKYFRDSSLEEVIAEGDEQITLKDVIADDTMRPDTIAENEELASEAQKILDSMPVKYKEVITLCNIQNLTYKEAAGIIGCSILTVMMRLKNAKKLFMKKLNLE